MNKEQTKRLTYVGLGVLLITTLCGILLVEHRLNIDYICPIKEFIGFECPGCGGTRMVLALLHGDILQSIRYNPFLFLTLPIMIILAIHQSIKFINIGDFSTWLDKVLITYAIMLLAFGILRNIPVLGWLKPTQI